MFKYLFLFFCKLLFTLYCLVSENPTLPNIFTNIIFKKCISKIKNNTDIIVITGSNGKTSTSAMLYYALQSESFKVISNYKYKNKKQGVSTSFIANYSWFGKLKADYFIIECPINTLPDIIKYIDVDVLLVSNIFPSNHLNDILSITKYHLEKALTKNGCPNIIINKFDPLAFHWFENHAPLLMELDFPIKNDTTIMTSCPKCLEQLEYSVHHYQSLGNYNCPNCNHTTTNLKSNFTLSNIDLDLGTAKYGDTKIQIGSGSIHKYYNFLHIISVLTTLNFNFNQISSTLNTINKNITFNHSFYLGNKQGSVYPISDSVNLELAVNSIASLPSVDIICFFATASEQNNYLSWLYKVNFKELAKKDTATIICSGNGGNLIYERLVYEGINKNKIKVIEDTKIALNFIRTMPDGFVYCISDENSFDNLKLHLKSFYDSHLQYDLILV